MKITKFEGTVEEFKAVSRLFEDNVDSGNIGAPEQASNNDEEEARSLARKAAYKTMLNRRPIPEGQLDVYKALAEGELEYQEYLIRMKRSNHEVAGVHGALGKRINRTAEIVEAGLPGNMEAVVTWRNEGGKSYLSLKPEFVEVLFEERVV